MYYPINYPFASFFKRLGFTVSVRIDVCFDQDAGVYVATSKDIAGLVLESETFSELTREVQEAIVTLTQLTHKNYPTEADLIYRDHIVIA